MCFVNFSNHMSYDWDLEQKKAAEKYGCIVDIPFPPVEPEYGENEIQIFAEKFSGEIMKYRPNAVMCQGEFTLCYAVVKKLLDNGVTVLAACTKRNVTEIRENGSVRKISEFCFVRFRRYTN